MVLWLKAFHVVAVISWMAGLLYLPRLFVYHATAKQGSEQSETFKVMEARLLRYIMTPAMVAVWASGLLLAWSQGVFHERWLSAKLLLVIALTVSHMACAAWRRAFAENRNTHSPGFYRAVNEAPTVLMIGIIVLVVVKPF